MTVNKKVILIAVAVMIAIVLTAILLFWLYRGNLNEPEDTDNHTTDTSSPIEQNPADPEDDWAILPDGPVREVPDLDDGNEDYLDMNVIAKLEEMEKEDEDTVDAMLDGLILLINHFVEKDYSYRAICQIQRFYFEFYFKLTDIPIETVIEKLTECVPAEGAVSNGFSIYVENLFGWEPGEDFSYIFETGDAE